jgi:hypothetical protein
MFRPREVIIRLALEHFKGNTKIVLSSALCVFYFKCSEASNDDDLPRSKQVTILILYKIVVFHGHLFIYFFIISTGLNS